MIVSGDFNNGPDDPNFQYLTELFFKEMFIYYSGKCSYKNGKELLSSVQSFLDGYPELF